MSKRIEDILTCDGDGCGKEVRADKAGYVGGHPFAGWWHLEEVSGNTREGIPKPRRVYDYCSVQCLKDHTLPEPGRYR